MRAPRSAAVLVLATLLVASCTPFTTPTPSPSPTPTASPTGTRPRFELATYQYALQTRGKIRVAIRDGGVPPLVNPRTGSGRIEGFEVDLARELARAIWGANEDPDAHIEWVSVDEATRLSALTSDRADVALAGIVITDETRKVVDLSDTYLHTGPRLLVKKTNDQIKEISDVASGEQTVCAVKQGRAGPALRKITNNGAKVLELESLDFCRQALASGAADAIADDETTLFGILFKQPADFKIVGNRFADDLLAIGIKRNSNASRQGFLEFVNGALLRIVADRTWARLYEKDVTPVSGDRKQIPTD